MRLSEIGGLTLVGAGFVVLFQRGIAGAFDVSYLFVTGVGVSAALLGLNYFNVGRQTRRRETVVDDVELRHETTVPGTETDELLADATGMSRGSVAYRRELRDRLRQVTVETLRRTESVGEATAEAAVADGDWTPDPVAAWFLADETDDAPFSVRVRGVVGSESGFAFAARRTTAAIAAVERGERPATAPPPDAPDGEFARLRRRLRDRLRDRLSSDDGDATEPDDDTGTEPGDGDGLPGRPGADLGRETGRAVTPGTDGDTADERTRTPTGAEHGDAWKLVEGEE
ncbi:hypothetical protein [Halobaculum sp. MBLA0143]|uniref:DUF7269 family protein n=1 Tax=Halobaculum sp. MBLA0143 TaxID=3079933 RepID=UPI0035255CC1